MPIQGTRRELLNSLPLPAEHLIREAVLKLAASRNHFKSRHVAEARELLEFVLREHGQLPWPPERITKKGQSIHDPH